MGGQSAEDLVIGDITTGASDDLQNATRIARKMVTEFGMSGKLGPRTFDTGQDMVFLGKELAQGHNYSDAVVEKIDAEIGDLLHKAQQTAKGILETQRAKLVSLAKRLMVDETVDGPERQELLAGSPEEVPLAA